LRNAVLPIRTLRTLPKSALHVGRSDNATGSRLWKEFQTVTTAIMEDLLMAHNTHNDVYPTHTTYIANDTQLQNSTRFPMTSW
jgi:hypothetical protein